MPKQKVMVTPEMNELILINENIINSLTTQKARSIETLEKYKKSVEDEARRPANKFMDWTRFVVPFMDRVVDLQVIDHDIITRYEEYVKKIIKENEKSIESMQKVQQISDDFERVLDILLMLEERFRETQEAMASEIETLRDRGVRYYSFLPKSFKQKYDGGCKTCGAKLKPDKGDGEEECRHCLQINAKKKEELKKQSEIFWKTEVKRIKKTPQERRAEIAGKLMEDGGKTIRRHMKRYSDMDFTSKEPEENNEPVSEKD
jgi:DUF4097 and DUF4098 domain-containing protein YvlB